jgi:predicted  nucleic acid-binding Zn-ribbon protein
MPLDQRRQNVVNEKQYLDALMAKKTQVMNDLNTFNQKYVEYVNCNNNCANLSIISSEYTASVTNLKNHIDEYKTLLNQSGPNQQKLKTNAEYQALNDPGIFTNSENNILRSELDPKLKEIYNINGTITSDGLVQYNSVIYTEILFTILATTLLYFTFTKL